MDGSGRRAELAKSVAEQAESLYDAVKALADNEKSVYPDTPYATTWEEVQQQMFGMKTRLIGVVGSIVMGAERT